MNDDTRGDHVRREVQRHADELAAFLFGTGPPQLDDEAGARTARAAVPGWEVRVTVAPVSPDDQQARTACTRKTRELLETAPNPLYGKEIRKQLEARKMGVFSIATVKRALRDLEDEVANRRGGRRRKGGYYLKDRMDLFDN